MQSGNRCTASHRRKQQQHEGKHDGQQQPQSSRQERHALGVDVSLLTELLGRALASHFAQHVIYDLAVLVLWAEQDDLGILADFDRVSGRPVE